MHQQRTNLVQVLRELHDSSREYVIDNHDNRGRIYAKDVTHQEVVIVYPSIPRDSPMLRSDYLSIVQLLAHQNDQPRSTKK